MEENSARSERATQAPVFAPYRRGYDPEQVDHYVAEQSLRTEAASARADEAERKLASAVQQLREMHRRITTLEAMEPVVQPTEPIGTISVDTLGVHVQRILSDAWEGSHALREEAEQDVARIKEQALAEGDRIVAAARRKAESIGEEMARRRQTYLEKLESERSRAVTQMGYLQTQRKMAVEDLHRVKTLVDTTIAEISGDSQQSSHPGKVESGAPAVAELPVVAPSAPTATPDVASPRAEATPAATMKVHRLPDSERHEIPDASELVRSHRAQHDESDEPTGVVRRLPKRETAPAPARSIFDFDEQEREDR